MNRFDAVHLDAAQVAAGEREEFIRAALSSGVIATDMEHLVGDSQAIDMRLDAAALGPLAVQSMRMSAIAARRTARLARDDRGWVLVGPCLVQSSRQPADPHRASRSAGGGPSRGRRGDLTA